jgi:hypothetical protein
VVEATSEPTASGRPRTVVLTTRAGGTLTATATDVRKRLALLSQYFRLGTLRLDPPAEAAVGGKRLRLTGVARDVDEPALERLGPNGWQPAARITARPDGTFAVSVLPTGETRYRLAAAGLAGPALLVRVGAGA